MKTFRLLALTLTLPTALFARQSPVTEAPAAARTVDFENHGEITAGYRFTDVSGYRPQFTQLFNLRKGFRVQDFTIHGTSKIKDGKSSAFADRYAISASGLGGDPYSTAELQAGKTGLYELRVQWRQNTYYWNQNDAGSLPISTAAAGLSKGLTDNHDWATVRKMGNINLTIHATNALRFNFETVRNTTDGTLLTTRSLDFFNPPSYWGAFARANPYPLYAPLHDETTRFSGGVDYTRWDLDFHYKAGFESFHENMTLAQTAVGETSINGVALSASEPLTALSWSQQRNLSAPLHEFSYRGKLHDKVEWRGGYVFSRHRGPATFDQSFSGTAPGSTGALAPYSVTEGGRTQVTEPSHAVNQGLTWHVRPRWDVFVDYRYTRTASESSAHLQSLLNGSVSSSGETDVTWENGLSDLSVSLAFTPIESLVLRPGIRLSKSDLETREDGVVDGARTLRTKHARPEMRFSYKPWAKLVVRGDLFSRTSGASYTAITPHTQLGARITTRYEPLPNLSVENNITLSSARLDDANYRNRVRADTLTVSYAPSDRVSVFASGGYDSFFAQGNIVYARGTAPLKSVLRDQEIHRVWQGGVDLKPVKFAGIQVTGNFDRLTGRGEITGEPPAYGPVTWPLATGTVYVDCPQVGRVSVDFQRTYYTEEIVATNNFSANLLSIRFTRSF